MEKEIKINEKAPKAIGPYSPSVKIDNLLFISGQIPIDPINGTIINGNIEEQTKRVLENLKLTLEPYAIGLEKIVKTTIFIKDMNNFSKINEIYSQYFTNKYPARSCVEVSRLPKDVQIEIEAIAYYE